MHLCKRKGAPDLNPRKTNKFTIFPMVLCIYNINSLFLRFSKRSKTYVSVYVIVSSAVYVCIFVYLYVCVFLGVPVSVVKI